MSFPNRYFVAGYHLRLDADDLTERLQEQWPDVAMTPIDNPHNLYVIQWLLHIAGVPIEGALSRKYDSVALSGDLRACAGFALWLRTWVPPIMDLSFYNDAFDVFVPIGSGTTAQDIIDGILSPPPRMD